MTLKEIVKQWLEENGYDGLCNPDDECGCVLEDFMSCGEPGEHCEAGHRLDGENEDGVGYLVAPGRKAVGG